MKIMVVGIERGAKGVSYWYGKVAENTFKINVGRYMEEHINSDGKVKIDFWS